MIPQQQGPLATIAVGEVEYQIHRISAIKQFHIARRLAPVVAALIPLLNISSHLAGLFDDGDNALPTITPERREAIFGDIVAAIPDLATAFAQLTDEDAEYILNSCLDACWRKQDTGWAKVRSSGMLMFADIELPSLMRLAFEAIRRNIGGFFEQGRLKEYAAGPK